MASLLDAINAAAAALSAKAETTESRTNGTTEPRVKPKQRVQPKSLTPDPSPRRGEKVQPKGSTNGNVNDNHEPLTLNPEPRVKPKQRVQPKSATSGGTTESRKQGTTERPKVQPKQPTKPTNPTEGTAPKAQPKKNTTNEKGQDFTGLFEGYLRKMIEAHLEKTAKADPAFAAKMKAKGKSIEGCLNYIGGHFYRQAQKQRKSGYVGIGGDDRELCGMAVHYYDESEESLKSELNGK